MISVAAAELLLPTATGAWTSTFIDVLGRLGIQPGTIRQALTRVEDTEPRILRSEAVGRRKQWLLTPEGQQLLSESTTRAFGFAQNERDWDGTWLIVLASVPENDRSTRYLLRSSLVWAGLGSPAPGVWVGTHTDRQAEVEEALAVADIADQARVFVAKHEHLSQMQSMVADAWDLDEISRGYEQFMVDFASAATDDPLTGVIDLVLRWTQVVLQDPALPAELLPASWPAREAAAVFLDRHERWQPDALQRWQEINV